MISSPLSNYLTQLDADSLSNIAKIKSDQVVDIYEDGTVSQPYTTSSFSGWTWTVANYYAGYASNDTQIANIQKLMERVCGAYIKAAVNCDFDAYDLFRSSLNGVAQGLTQLAHHYELENNSVAQSQLKGISAYVNRALSNTSIILNAPRTGLNVIQSSINKQSLDPRLNAHLHQLEQSIIGVGGADGNEDGRDYYINRLNEFLKLESSHLTSTDDIFLNWLKTALKDSSEGALPRRAYLAYVKTLMMNDLRTEGIIDSIKSLMMNLHPEEKEKVCDLDGLQVADEIYTRVIEDITLNQSSPLPNEMIEMYKTCRAIGENAIETLNKEFQAYAQHMLDKLDKMPTEYRSQVGIFIPLSWDFMDKKKGHFFSLSLCKEVDGTYTLVKANAGALEPTDGKMEFQLQLGLNPFKMLLTGNTVSEFTGLSREQAFEFLTQAKKSSYALYKDMETAQIAYNSLFINYKKSPPRIQERRFQTEGNCGIRNWKELLIFSFQKAGKIDLANKFMRYGEARTAKNSLPFQDVAPLIDPTRTALAKEENFEKLNDLLLKQNPILEGLTDRCRGMMMSEEDISKVIGNILSTSPKFVALILERMNQVSINEYQNSRVNGISDTEILNKLLNEVDEKIASFNEHSNNSARVTYNSDAWAYKSVKEDRIKILENRKKEILERIDEVSINKS